MIRPLFEVEVILDINHFPFKVRNNSRIVYTVVKDLVAACILVNSIRNKVAQVLLEKVLVTA